MENKDLEKELDLDLFDNKKNKEEKTSEVIKRRPTSKGKKVYTIKDIIIAIVLSILILAAILLTGFSVIKGINPVAYISGEISKSSLYSKWQIDSDDSSISNFAAFEFFEDGTYSYYLLGYSFDGVYTVQGNEITMTANSQTFKYEYKISGDKLYLKKSNSDLEYVKYSKVSQFNIQSFGDILESITGE